MSRLFALSATVVMMLALPVLAAGSDTSQGSYTARIEIKALRNEKTGRTPQLPFSGSFARSGAKFRMDVVNDLTTETQVLIMDSGAKQGWLLFPDTLNGLSADLSSFDKKGLMTHLQKALTGEFGTVPQGWSKADKATEQLNGSSVTHLTYTLPQITGSDGKKANGGKVHFWHKADLTPVQLVVDSAAMKLTVTFSGVTRGGKVDSAQFAPGKTYKIRPLGKGEPLPLPGGLTPDALGL